MTTTETATTRALGPKTTEIRIRGFTLIQDKPPEFGGTDRGPMASEYLLAAWGACMTTTFTRIAGIRKVPVDDLEVITRIVFDDKGTTQALELDANVTSPAETKAVDKVFELAARTCTIAQLLGGVDVRKQLIHVKS